MKVILINEMKTQDDESTFLTLQMKLIMIRYKIRSF